MQQKKHTVQAMTIADLYQQRFREIKTELNTILFKVNKQVKLEFEFYTLNMEETEIDYVTQKGTFIPKNYLVEIKSNTVKFPKAKFNNCIPMRNFEIDVQPKFLHPSGDKYPSIEWFFEIRFLAHYYSKEEIELVHFVDDPEAATEEAKKETPHHGDRIIFVSHKLPLYLLFETSILRNLKNWVKNRPLDRYFITSSKVLTKVIPNEYYCDINNLIKGGIH